MVLSGEITHNRAEKERLTLAVERCIISGIKKMGNDSRKCMLKNQACVPFRLKHNTLNLTKGGND